MMAELKTKGSDHAGHFWHVDTGSSLPFGHREHGNRLLHIVRNFEVLVMFTLFWMIMNESASWIVVVSGLLLSIVILWVTNLLDHADYASDVFRSPLVVIRYFMFLAKEVFLAAIAMAKAIITGRARMLEFHYHSRFREERKLFLLATAIIMTPGSITVFRRRGDLLVLSVDEDVQTAEATISRLEDRIAEITK
jgi:multicomponent Na+:H+ antiporter subunit E